MPFYLLQENGDKLLLEDGSGFLILESVTVPGPTINYQGGAGYPVRQRRRREADKLFASIERFLQEAMGLVPPSVENPVLATVPIDEEVTIIPWSDHAIQATLGQLRDLAQGHADLERRFARLQALLVEHATEQAARTDEEEAWIFMS